jgi:putative membrane protein
VNESQRLRRFAFRAPKFYLVLPLIVVLIPLFYFTSLDLRFTFIYTLSIASLIIWDLLSPRIFKFKFSPQRVLFLNVVSLYFATIFYLIVIAFHFLKPPLALLVSITSIPFLRTMVYITFTNKNVVLIHTIAISFSLLFSFYIGLLDPKYMIFILPLVLSSIVYALASHLFVKLSVSRFVKEFSTDPIKILREFANTVTTEISYNVILKKFFEDMYATLAPREISLLRMKSESQNLTMVFPYVHPGPLGDLGSSNISAKLQKNHEDQKLMVFHTTTTHDDNCAGDSEIDKISKVIDESGKESTYCYEPYFGKYLTFLPLGDGGIFFISPDDPRFDDVKITEGRKIVRKAKLLGLKWAVTIDQHNNNMDEPKELEDISYLLKEVEQAVKSRKSKKTISVAYSRSVPEYKDIGPGGIAFVSISIGSKKIAIILFDGNNMEYEFRQKVESSLDGYDKILVCTTDNHIVNTNGLNVNPVGRFSDHDEIVKIVKKLEEDTLNQKEVRMEYVKRDIWLKVAGENQWAKINSIIKSSVNKAKVLSVASIVVSIALSLIIFKIIPLP